MRALRATGRRRASPRVLRGAAPPGLPRQPREYFAGRRRPGGARPSGAAAAGRARTRRDPRRGCAARRARRPTASGAASSCGAMSTTSSARARRLTACRRRPGRGPAGAARGGPAHLRDPRGQGGAGGVAVARRADPVLARRRPRGPDEPAYSFAAIDHLVELLEADDAAWRAWFAAGRPGPARRSLRRPEADPAGDGGGVLRFVGADDADVAAPALRRQADERSAQWAAHYAAEAVRARACRTCSGSSPTRSTSCARSPPSSSGRSCCSRAARTRSCCCAWRRRRSGPAACRSR